MDAEHQVDAAAEIQPELQLFGLEPRRRGHPGITIGEDGVDAEHEENGKDADDGENFPADVLHDD
jgi:hypothetical protein